MDLPLVFWFIGCLLVLIFFKIKSCINDNYSDESEAQVNTREYFEPSAPPFITYSLHSETNTTRFMPKSSDVDLPPSYSQIYSVNQSDYPSKSSEFGQNEPPNYYQTVREVKLPIIYETNEEYL